MLILVLNCGSSSLKFQLIETSPEQITANRDRTLGRGSIERIGAVDSKITFEIAGGEKQVSHRPVLKHKEAIETAFEWLTGESKLIGGAHEIEGAGHRIVHGGESFKGSALITDDVLKEIEKASDLAPLHNPHNLKGYFAAKALLPQAAQVAVFDTAFHQTMPAHAYLYAVPYIYYTRDKLRRYGFHGTSHRYVSYRFAQIHGKKRSDFRLITCHLGNGCSVCAIEHGESIDTSMGFTPLEGLVMGTRSGDVDPGAVLYMIDRAEMGAHEVDVTLNTQSGLYGISGVSGDMRDLLAASGKGVERAKLAVDAFCYRVTKYIGAVLRGDERSGCDRVRRWHRRERGGGAGEDLRAVGSAGAAVRRGEERGGEWRGEGDQRGGIGVEGLGDSDGRGTADRARHAALHSEYSARVTAALPFVRGLASLTFYI